MKTFLISITAIFGFTLGKCLWNLIGRTHENKPSVPDAPTPPQRMEVISSFQAPSGYTGTILRDRETGEEYMTIHHGGAVHLVKPSTAPKP